MLKEIKSLPLELDSLDMSKGTATIAHAAYDNVDLVDDIGRKGMFKKTWEEKKLPDGYDISFYLNHDDTQAPGRIIKLHDDNKKAYTDVKMGTHTLGTDTLIQMDEKIIRKASYGFFAVKAKRIKSENKSLRELNEVEHLETSVLTRLSANPIAGVIKVNKHLTGILMDIKALENNEQSFLRTFINGSQDSLEKLVRFSGSLDPSSDLYTATQYWIGNFMDHMGDMKSSLKYNVKELLAPIEVKGHLANLRKFVINTKASDEAILDAQREIKSLEDAIVFDTADTPLIAEPSVSDTDANSRDFAEQVLLLSLKHF